jgi:hypothetical protein
MPNIEQQQQTKNNYNDKYRTAATNKNQLPVVQYLVL